MLNPKSFNADKIVEACKAGGLKGLVVVAKHHDGFCLWPSKTTSHNITKSPFRNGKGDYLKEMADACHRAGLKLGVYISPWDRNSPHYGTDKYVEIFHEQIKEVLNGYYGDIFEIWFDGANGGNGWYGGANESRKISPDYYRFDKAYSLVRKLQPNITIFAGENDDSDYRWPGNEQGILDNNSRATITHVGGIVNGEYLNADYFYQIKTGMPNGSYFRMCEADFPLRKGWFYHDCDNGTTRNAALLTKRFLLSVGNGGTMDIGIAPNQNGVLAQDDINALKGFNILREALFANEINSPNGLVNMVEMNEDLSMGEQVDHWRIKGGEAVLLDGRSIGSRRIRFLPKTIAKKDLSLHITAHGGNLQKITLKCYYVDPKLISLIEDDSTPFVETDTAQWMTGNAIEEPKTVLN